MIRIQNKGVIFFLEVFLGLVFLLQPLVIYLTAYDPGDCDDKAVHYYSAAYASASEKTRNDFFKTINPFISSNSKNPSWQRTEFRLNSANNYPLANLFISNFQSDKEHFTKAVNMGLFLVTLTAIIVVLLIGSKTQFGFWQTTLVLNLVAFYTFKIHFLVEQVPRNMHPFIAYVPRGAGALMVIPIVLAFASKKWLLLAISIFLTFFWHIGLGLISAALAICAVLVYLFVTKFKLYKSNLIFIPLLAGVVGGINSVVTMLVLGLVFYIFKNSVGINLKDFYHRAFLFGFFLFLIITLTITYTSIPQVSLLLGSIAGDPVFQELPIRLAGIDYTLLVLLTVIGIRIFGVYFFEKYLSFKKKPPYISTSSISSGKTLVVKQSIKAETREKENIPSFITESFICILVMSFLFLNHLPEYSWVARGASGFFLPTCREVIVHKIPSQLNNITLGNEPDMFVSFGNYIFKSNR
jgi:hypothetical protein